MLFDLLIARDLTPITALQGTLVILLLAMVLDLLLGDPKWLYRRIPHPVVVLGRLIDALEGPLNRQDQPRGRRLILGLLCTTVVVLTAAVIGAALHAGLHWVQGGWVLEAVLASSLLAFRGLYDAVRTVAKGLSENLQAGREAVGHIVGRDANSLDNAGVARAAAESAAENFSDGFVAPVFWFLVFGFPGLLAYKAVNTLDSMIGHRNARFEAFGKAAARLDDAVNYLPARLAGLLIVAGTLVVPGARTAGAWSAMLRDAGKHRSPNAGWQEAALAGGLGIALAGPRHYGGQTVEDSWMGDGRADLRAEDLGRVLDLYLAAGILLFVLLAASLLVLR